MVVHPWTLGTDSMSAIDWMGPKSRILGIDLVSIQLAAALI